MKNLEIVINVEFHNDVNYNLVGRDNILSKINLIIILVDTYTLLDSIEFRALIGTHNEFIFDNDIKGRM